MTVIISPGTVQLERDTWAVDFEDTDVGGTFCNAFLRGVYLITNYDNTGMEIVQAEHRARKRLEMVAI